MMGTGVPRDTPLLLHVFSTFQVGGPQARFVEIVNALGGEFRHLLVAMDGRHDCIDGIAPGIDLEVLRPEYRKGDQVRAVRAFRRILRERRPDLLITSNWGSIDWAFANLTGIVRHVHLEDGFGPDEADGQKRRRVWTRRLALRRSVTVVPSRTLLRIALDRWRLPVDRVAHVPNGVDLERFSGTRPQTAARDRPVVGTVAALRREKNLERLLRAIRRLSERRPIRLEIVGDGPERAHLETVAAEIGVRGMVDFLGHFSAPEEAYRRFDVFALSSDTEQMPCTVLEAMASGLPVAATNVGDVAWMLADENRLFLAHRDDGALAERLGALLADANLRHRLGAANRTRAERSFGRNAMIETWRRIFAGERVAQDLRPQT